MGDFFIGTEADFRHAGGSTEGWPAWLGLGPATIKQDGRDNHELDAVPC
jgi:hypothetical protein